MKITLIRHGRPDVETSGRVSPKEFSQWVDAYDRAGLAPDSRPEAELVRQLEHSRFVVCSHLPRSLESAAVLKVDPDISSELFRECEMPKAGWSHPSLSIRFWSVFFRVLQIFGYSHKAESLDEIRQRADLCAEQLIDYAGRYGSVVFIGHGTINWFIHRRLLRQGWAGSKRPNSSHWGCNIYRVDTAE